MENSRVIKYRILCVLHEVNFDEVDDKILDYIIVESNQLDLGLAIHQVRKRVDEFNKVIDQKYLISVDGYYRGKAKNKAVHVNEFNLKYVKRRIKEVA